MNNHLSSIHPSAQIGTDVTISPFVTIYGDVVIGDNTWIGPNVTIMDGARIGRNCRIFPGAVISAIPQDLKFDGEQSIVEIGDNVTIREFVTVNKGTVDRMKTSVGDNTLLMAYVHVAHDCIIGKNCIIANAVNMAGHVLVDDFVVIGGMSAVHQFVHIGKHAMLSGGSLVRKDIPPFIRAGREPLSYIGVNSIGLRRRGFSNEAINEIQDVYRKFYLSGMNTSQALDYIEKFLPVSIERDEILQFVQMSKRGIIRTNGGSED